MNATVDSKRRVVLPKTVKPGQVFDIQETGPGRILLERLEKPAQPRRAWLEHKEGGAYLRNGHEVTLEDYQQVKEELLL
jgi:bifunctional DNA-binding transcriptional regulator/antitoxin component of YhaV-PrlF toxin-antitoxin module